MTTWDLSMHSNNPFVYTITNVDNNTSLGTNWSTSFYDQFELVIDNVVSSTEIHAYIKYCHPNGTNYYLSLVDGTGTDPDSNLQISAYTQVKWIPQTNLANTTQAKWKFILDPSDDSLN